MSIHIYHPNKAVKGFACSFWFSERDNSLYATLIKQSGWDDKNQNGTFKASLNDPTKKVNIKLSPVEACGILDCIERNRTFSTFHDFEESPKAISLAPWMNNPIADDDGNRPPAVQKGFSFSVSVNNKSDPTNKNSFYIGLTFAEARYIREYILHCLHLTFEDKRYIASPEPVQNMPAPSSNLVDI